MELKDVILSTLAELDDIVLDDTGIQHQKNVISAKEPSLNEPILEVESSVSFANVLKDEVSTVGSDDEVRMLEGIRERLLVLFEGFQSPNNVNIEAKVDLTLNFFEYLLATIDNRLDTIRS